MASSDDEKDVMEVESRKVKAINRKIFDSDSSDGEKSEIKDPARKLSDDRKIKANESAKQLHSDSSDDEESALSKVSEKINETTESQDPDESFKNSNQKSKLYDTDSSDDDGHKSAVSNKSKDPEESVSSTKQKSKLIDSDTSDEEEPQEKPTKNRRKGNPKKFEKKIKEKPQRKSAKAAMEGIKDELNLREISEKQKEERDREINIPYHKPKQFTLKEFLARRNINKPNVGSAAVECKPTILQMKMNTEDLEKFAEKMKAREQEAIEFFKSESEDEEMDTQSESVKSEVPKETIEVDEKPQTPPEIESVTDEPIEHAEKITEEELSESPDKENNADQLNSPTKKSALKTLDEMSGKDVIIDLTTGSFQPKVLTGADLLLNRYMKTISKPKQKESVCMNILTVENGKVENQRVEVKLDKKIELDQNRPGYSHEHLKEQLFNKIVQKRLEENRKKTVIKPEPMEFEPEDKCKINENTESVKNVESSDEEYDPDNDSDEMASDNEVEDKKETKSAFVDDEAEDEDPQDDEQSDESSSSSDESEVESYEINQEKKKGRILKAFADSDDEIEPSSGQAINSIIVETQEENYKNTQDPTQDSQNFNSERSDFTFSQPSVSQEIKTSHLNELFDSEKSQYNADDDLMALCSGQFTIPRTHSIPVSQLAGLSEFNYLLEDTDDFVSQVPEKIDEPFDTQQSEQIVENPIQEKSDIRKLLESSDDDEESTKPEKPKIKKKKKKRKQVKLGFSDDESDLENKLHEDILDGDELQEEVEEEETNEDVLIDYDSEENEIEVKVTEKQKIKMTNEYFDKEAELSESEWGSADEDEKGMDTYEADLADEEEFDQVKLREEVGRIHARKLMDDDLKNVKKIQDLLFEDEENDGVGRERKFRWKNQAEGFTMVDENAMDGDNLENVDNDDESEMMWRKMRHEREVLINEQSQKTEGEIMSEDILLLDQNSQTVSCTNSSVLVKRKFQIIRSTSTTFGALNNSGEKKDSPFLIKNGKSAVNNSFLSRDSQTLRRIASFMSNKGDDEVTNLSSHGANSMSFVPCEKPSAESKKRKSEGTKEETSVKKRKVESKGFLLLDKLH